MKPNKKSNKNLFLHGDSIEILKQIPDRTVDLVILDPPYWKVVNQKWDFEWRTLNDYSLWCAQWLQEVSRVMKRGASLYLFGYTRNLIPLYPILVELGLIFRQDITIDKGIQAISGRATKNYKQFPNTTENLWFFVKDSKPFIKKYLQEQKIKKGLSSKEINEALGAKTNGGGVWSLYTGNNILAQVPTEEMWDKLQKVLDFELPYSEIGQTFNTIPKLTNVWNDISFYKEKRIHPTQKPLELIKRLIEASSNENMVILDPFMGSGTTAVAADNLNRKFIGIEKDQKHYTDAVRRLELLDIKFITTIT